MTRKTSMKFKIIPLAIWRWEGCVCTGGTSASFAAWVLANTAQVIEPDKNAAGHAFMHPGHPWALWVQDITQVSVLAHEALHITAGLLSERGLQFGTDSEEAYTYTMQFIMDATLQKGGWSRA